MTKQSTTPTLPWKYCECGCKGHAVQVGILALWLFNDLQGGYHLYRGHGLSGKNIGSYASFEKADAAARAYAKPHFLKMKAEFEQLAPLFADEAAPATEYPPVRSAGLRGAALKGRRQMTEVTPPQK